MGNESVLSLVIGTYCCHDHLYFLPKIFQHLDFKTISNVIEWKYLWISMSINYRDVWHWKGKVFGAYRNEHFLYKSDIEIPWKKLMVCERMCVQLKGNKICRE